MKQLLLFLLIIGGFGYAYASMFKPKQQQPKKYFVSFTATEWEGKLQWMQIVSEIMRKSSLPGNVISQYQDSLTIFMQDAVKQLQPQIQKDTVKPKK